MDIPAMSRAFDIPEAATAAGLQELAARAYVTLDDAGTVTGVTDAGREVAEKLIAERTASLERLVEGWAPEQHPDLALLLTRMARELQQETPVETPVPAPA
jgi:hypothetical protein